jgi:CHAT domain-containing protein/tetratricopeptide (TPR) repeat protein
MNEERLQDYLNLIQALLDCPNGEEGNVLNAHQHLIDADLVQVMAQVAEMMGQQGKENNVRFLTDLAQEIAAYLGNTLSAASPEEYIAFLLEVLQATSESNGNPQVAYPILEANQDKLNQTLVRLYSNFVNNILSQVAPEQARNIGVDFVSFSNLIQQFPKGNRASNLEIAIIGYELVLNIFTTDKFPEEWATTQNNLANAYYYKITGNRAENIDTAIACYQKALEIRTREDFPEKWAETQNNLAAAYSNKITGNRAENIDRAINCYQKALEVRTRKDFPEDWAGTQNNLANAYSSKITGNRAENIDRAINCYQKALEVRTREDFPQDWAMTQNNLATAYSDKITGNRAENIDTAIDYYQKALEVRTREDFPENWATTQNNLAAAYSDKITGNRAENIDTAIDCYQLALAVYTREDFPENWAETQNNLANAYSNKITGNRAENIYTAIACYQRALEVRTREDFPQDWAMTQNNLGTAYYYKITGNRAENIDTAIDCYQKALEVRTREDFPEDWAMTQDNLATAYYYKITGNRSENIDTAIDCYQKALEVRTREDFPEKWAETQNNLAIAYGDKITGNRAENIDTAIACYRLALEFRTPTTLPLGCLKSGRNLGNLAFKEGLWEIAIEGYEPAINAVEKSRSWSTTDASRQQILADSIDVYANIIQAYINNGNLEKAIAYVDRSRSKRLVDLMASNDLYAGGEIPPQVQAYLQQHDELQAQIDAERKRLQSDSDSSKEKTDKTPVALTRAALEAATVTIENLEAQKQQIWEQMRRLDPVLAGEIQVTPLDFPTIQQLIEQPHTAILNFFTTDNDTHIFIIYKDKKPQLHTCTGFGYQTLRELVVNEWLIPYFNRKRDGIWYAKISEFLQQLAKKLQLKTLVQTYLSGIEELIIIPHLFWHQIPFAALPLIVPTQVNSQPSANQYFGDKFRLRYVPSSQILQYCQQRPPLSQINYGTVENPDNSLPNAEFECEKIAKFYNIPANQRLKGRDQATVSNYRQLAKQVQVLHSSHHASSRLDSPLESVLILADGNITLGQIMTPGFRLPNLSDVFLSCCETNLGVAGITDDILSLSTGFLCAGARSVVSTLWAVDDLATALFSIFYYQNRQQGLNRPEALRKAQDKLRNFPGKTLETDYKGELETNLQQQFEQATQKRQKADKNRKRLFEGTPEYQRWDEEYKQWDAISSRIFKVKESLKNLCRQDLPFATPYYWAGFICSGLS